MDISGFLWKWVQSIIELLTFFPIIFFVGISLVPGQYLWLWLLSLPLCYISGMCVRFIIGNRWRSLVLIANAAIAGIVAFISIGRDISANGIFHYLTIWVIAFAFIYRGTRMIECHWEKLFPISTAYIGLMMYFLAFFLFQKALPLRPYIPLIGCTGILSLIASLVRLNSVQLRSVALPRGNESILPVNIITSNRIFITSLLILILIAASWKQITSGFILGISKIFYNIYRLFKFVIKLVHIPRRKIPGIEAQIGELIPDAAENTWITFIEKMMSIVVFIIYIALIVLTLYAIFRMIYSTVRWVVKFIKRFLEGANQIEELYKGYEDKNEMLIDWQEAGKKYLDRIKDWLAKVLTKEPRWADLNSNRERIRYIYRHIIFSCIESGYKFKKHMTPHELWKDMFLWDNEKVSDTDELINVYNNARYGDKEIDDDKVEKFVEYINKNERKDLT